MIARYAAKKRGQVVPFEGTLSCRGFVEDDSQGENIRPPVHDMARHLFRDM